MSTTMIPGCLWHPSTVPGHASGATPRISTWSVTIHWTSGRGPGDISTLDGPDVDSNVYIEKSGRSYQFTHPDSISWHAFHTANQRAFSIETEGSGEAWTSAQLREVARVAAWAVKRYGIPIRKVDPIRAYPDSQRTPPPDWWGLFGHADLAHIDGNDHSDTVPRGIGWSAFLAAVKHAAASPTVDLDRDAYLRLDLNGQVNTGWTPNVGRLRWIATNGLAPSARCAIAWRGPGRTGEPGVWRGPKDVRAVARDLITRFG